MEGIAKVVVDCAFKVHSALGPGLLESAYQTCLDFELKERGFFVEREKPLPLIYKDVKLDCGYRIDLLVENQILIEIKSVDSLAPIHLAQILTYMRLANKTLGFLINFNVDLLKNGGIRRVVNNYVPKI